MLDTNKRDEVLDFAIDEIQKVQEKIRKAEAKLASLKLDEKDLAEQIIWAMGHNHDGQDTKPYKQWSITCKTPMVYSLDKKAYESGSIYLDPGFNPIKASVSYTIDKSLCGKYMQEAPESVRLALDELITTNPGKISVSIKARM